MAAVELSFTKAYSKICSKCTWLEHEAYNPVAALYSTAHIYQKAIYSKTLL
jgi:hypothetical protein